MKQAERLTRRRTLVAGGLGATGVAAALAASPAPAQAQNTPAIVGTWLVRLTGQPGWEDLRLMSFSASRNMTVAHSPIANDTERGGLTYSSGGQGVWEERGG